MKKHTTFGQTLKMSSSSSSASFRVLSFNTASFNDGPLWCSTLINDETGRPLWNYKNRHRQIVKDMILKENAQVVCLQESVIKAPKNDNNSFPNDNTKMTFMKRRKQKLDSYKKRINENNQARQDEVMNGFSSSSDDEEIHQNVLRDAHIDEDEIDEANDMENGTAVGGSEGPLPVFSLDGNDENENDASAMTRDQLENLKQIEQEEQDPLPGYCFIGQTATHADYTSLWVRQDLESSIVKIDRVGGERGGDQYNFPICVLKISQDHFVAVTSVHMTPFSSGGGGRRGKETRRETQLRKTTHALYRSLDDYFSSSSSETLNKLNEDDDDTSGEKKLSFSIIIAGDTNMRNEEHSVAKKSLKLIDVHDYLREKICSTSSSPLFLHQNEEMISLQKIFGNDKNPNDDKGSSSLQQYEEQTYRAPLWTWNTVENRYNGQGPEYCSRYDRLYVRNFCGISVSDVRKKLTELMKESLMIQSNDEDEDDKKVKEELLYDETKIETLKQQQDNHIGSNAPLQPQVFRLFGHKPVFDSEIDEVDRRTLEEFCEKRKGETMMTSGENDDDDDNKKKKPSSTTTGWVSVFREDDDEDDDEQQQQYFPDTKNMITNDPQSNKLALNLGGLSNAVKNNKNTKFDELLFELAMNEHTNNPPPPEGRKRYLSDHFGFVVEFSFS